MPFSFRRSALNRPHHPSKALGRHCQLSEGDLIETRLAQGTITSVVKTH